MLMSDSWTITEDSLRACLPTRYKNFDLHNYDTIDSTNLKSQTAGDGWRTSRNGRFSKTADQRKRLARSKFFSRRRIYLSIVIKPGFDVSKLFVTSAAAVAVAKRHREGLRAGIEDQMGQRRLSMEKKSAVS